MESDPANLDPEERQNAFFALLAAALGLLSLCGAIMPVCGAGLGLLGLLFGFAGRKSENRKLATAGLALSALGILIAAVYAAFVYIAGTPNN